MGAGVVAQGYREQDDAAIHRTMDDAAAHVEDSRSALHSLRPKPSRYIGCYVHRSSRFWACSPRTERAARTVRAAVPCCW